MQKKMKLGDYPIPHTKINAKLIRPLNIRDKTVKLLKENMGNNLYDTGFCNDFLDMMPKTQAREEKQFKQTSSKLTNFMYQMVLSRQ